MSFPRSCPLYPWAVVMSFILLLGSCGGDSNDTFPQARQRTTSSIELTKVPPPLAKAESAAEQSAPPSLSSPESAEKLRDSMQLAQLARNPYLSTMSQEELLAFRNQIRSKSPSQRRALLKQYPSLSSLPVQQKELLLGQLIQIVPITTQSVLLTCTCENGFKREMCVQESCGNSEAAAHFSICQSVCGASSQPLAVCMPSQQCSGK